MTKKPRRLIFLDMLRLLAVGLMVQGHTIRAYLDPALQDPSYPAYDTWRMIRGYTAPMFLMVSGAVFGWLLLRAAREGRAKERIGRALKRGLLVIAVGYALRFPNPAALILGKAEPGSWAMFATPDVLHLIGLVLILLALSYALSSRLRLPVLIPWGLMVILPLWLYTQFTDWQPALPPAIGLYLQPVGGANFPLIPWAAYMALGACAGVALASVPVERILRPKVGMGILLTGILLICAAWIGDRIEFNVLGYSRYWQGSPNLFIHRAGVVIALAGTLHLICLRIQDWPQLLRRISKEALWVYALHLVILYHIMKPIWPGHLPLGAAVGLAIWMELAVAGFVWLLYRWRDRKKQSPSA